MKKFIKKNIKFIFGLIIGIIISGAGVYAATILYAANAVSYDNSNYPIQKNGENVTNVQDAIETLYEKALVCENGGSGGSSIGTIPSCPDCEFMHTTNTYQYGANGTTRTQIENTDGVTLSSNYNDVITETRKYFLGVKFNGDKVEKAYACGVNYNNQPFCMEGGLSGLDSSLNIAVLIGGTTPISPPDSCMILDSDGGGFLCNFGLYAYLEKSGKVAVYNWNGCHANSDASFGCDD